MKKKIKHNSLSTGLNRSAILSPRAQREAERQVTELIKGINKKKKKSKNYFSDEDNKSDEASGEDSELLMSLLVLERAQNIALSKALERANVILGDLIKGADAWQEDYRNLLQHGYEDETDMEDITDQQKEKKTRKISRSKEINKDIIDNKQETVQEEKVDGEANQVITLSKEQQLLASSPRQSNDGEPKRSITRSLSGVAKAGKQFNQVIGSPRQKKRAKAKDKDLGSAKSTPNKEPEKVREKPNKIRPYVQRSWEGETEANQKRLNSLKKVSQDDLFIDYRFTASPSKYGFFITILTLTLNTNPKTKP